MSDEGHEFVFYVYDDEDEGDPRFSFWLEMDDGGGMSLYERPPDGQGMWLKPSDDAGYDGVSPTEGFVEAAADLMGDGMDGERLTDLPPHERYFMQVIVGTVEQNPDAIPDPVWSFMHECADEVNGSESA